MNKAVFLYNVVLYNVVLVLGARAGGVTVALNLTEGVRLPREPARPLPLVLPRPPGRALGRPKPAPTPSPSAPTPREAEQRREREMRVYCRNGVQSQARPSRGSAATHTEQGSSSASGLPQLPLTSPGRGNPGSSPGQAHAPGLSPTPAPPSVAEHQFPSLLAQGTPPSQPEESCTDHLHCRAAPHWGHEKPQQRCWGSYTLPVAPELLGIDFLLCLPSGTTSSRALLTRQPLQTVAATPTARQWGGGQGLSFSSQDI